MDIDVRAVDSDGTAAFKLSYGTVKAYLTSCRTHLRKGMIFLPDSAPPPPSEVVTIHLAPPHLKQAVHIQCRLQEPEKGGYLLKMEPLGKRERVILGTYTSLAESIWRECMESAQNAVAAPNSPSLPKAAPKPLPKAVDLTETAEMPLPGSEDTQTSAPEPLTLPDSGGAIPVGLSPSMDDTLQGLKSPFAEKEAEVATEGAPGSTDTLPPLGMPKYKPTDPDLEIPMEAPHVWDLEVEPATGLPLQGSFESLSPAATVVRITSARGTGILSLLSDKGMSRIYFKRGRIIEVEDDELGANSRLGQILLKMGRLRDDERTKAIAEASTCGKRLGRWLVSKRKATEDGIRRGMEAQIRYRLGVLERKGDGAFRFSRRQVIPEPGAPMVNPVQTLYRKWSRSLGQRKPEDVLAVESKVINAIISPTEEGNLAYKELNLDSEERRLWQLMHPGKESLAQIYLATSTSRRKTHGVIFAWEKLGLVTFAV